MSLKIGIVGLPNVGKSTLFNALTRQKVDVSNYPFCTIDPNVGVVHVPDERLNKLALLSHSRKLIPAVVEFVDIAGLVKGAAEGEGLGNKFLSHIREVDAIAEVVRIFEDPKVIHVENVTNPLKDIEVLEYELILKDLETITKRLESARSDAKGQKKGARELVEKLERVTTELKSGHLLDPSLTEYLSELQLLTAKPFIYIFNASEEQLTNGWKPEIRLQEKISKTPLAIISAKIEAELNDLPLEEKTQYLESLGLSESGLDQMIRISYATLGLITFFTTGEDETRAWTIPKNSFAPRAGRAVHSDFEEKFIRADVIQWKKLLEAGSWPRARELGWLRTEGKGYVIQDGDTVEFKI